MSFRNFVTLFHHPIAHISLRIFLTCWLVYVFHFATNTVREIYPALSLGDSLSFNVSEYLGLHPDIFEIPGRGAFINNNPGASILGAVPYIFARPVIDRISQAIQQKRAASGAPIPEYETTYPMAREFYRQAYLRGLDVKFGLAAGVMQAFLMAPLSALSAAVIFWMMVKLTESRSFAVVLAFLYAFATPVFYRTAQLNHNLLETDCALFALALIWSLDPGATSPRRKLIYLASGLLIGWTVVLDYSGILLIIALGSYGVYRILKSSPERDRLTDLAFLGFGVVAAASVLPLYQWLAFGNPLYPAQYYMPETNYSNYGLLGMDWPQLDLLWKLVFGIQYGLFTSAPFLVLALIPAGWTSARVRLMGRAETLLILGLTIGFYLFTAANQYSRMQFNSGIRHLVPIVPFLFIIAAGVWLRLPKPWAWIAGISGALWSWCLAMYRDVEQGWGILESLRYVFTHGPRFPWLATLESLGLIPKGLEWLVLITMIVLVSLIWIFPLPVRQHRPLILSQGG